MTLATCMRTAYSSYLWYFLFVALLLHLRFFSMLDDFWYEEKKCGEHNVRVIFFLMFCWHANVRLTNNWNIQRRSFYPVVVSRGGWVIQWHAFCVLFQSYINRTTKGFHPMIWKLRDLNDLSDLIDCRKSHLFMVHLRDIGPRRHIFVEKSISLWRQ